jgi:NDP-4-keto-2,6-dideoxyhexose 3-C-methyltransferase
MSSVKITECRICGNQDIPVVFDLGVHHLSSRFPAANEPDPIQVPLELVKCNDLNNDCCGLLQLSHNTSEEELYLHDYGYRSGLNNTMINHLTSLVNEIQDTIKLNENDIVLDIGSNDSTLLRAYPNTLIKVGIDPTGTQFKEFYPDNVTLLPTFFDASVYNSRFTEKSKVITSVSMFYDLPSPLKFAQDIKSILAQDGIWVSEQSYCVTMLENNSFDTICHEHLEYYTLKQFQFIANHVGLQIINVTLNSCNGGSFRVTLAYPGQYPVNPMVNELLNQELELNLSDLKPIYEFIERCEEGKDTLMTFLRKEHAQNKTIYLYGASCKGNSLLQYYGLDNSIISAAAERNEAKYGCRTPRSHIPIIPESEMRENNPDYLLVLPWHFKKEFLEREKEYIENGGCIIFPMPTLEFYRK